MMVIKKIGHKYFDQLSTFFIENNVEAVTNSFMPFELSVETARWIACESYKDQFFLGLLQNKPVGFSMLRGWDEGYVVPSLGIFIDYRKHGCGHGKELLDLTIGEAKDLNCSKIRLSAFASNIPACKIYLSRGFKETERINVIHNRRPDQKIIMVKDLTK